MIEEQIIKPNPHNHEAFVYKFTKLNAKPGEKKFYLGWHLEKPDDGYSHSSTDDDLDLDVSKFEFKYEILNWGTADEMKTKEYNLLKMANATISPEWYNKHPGATSSVEDIDLSSLSQWADEIKKTNSFKGNKSFIKVYSKKLMKSEINKDFAKLQIREETEIASNTAEIKNWIDKHQGDLKKLLSVEKVNLLVVVLEDIEKDGQIVHLIVGGNHTIQGTIQSKHGKEIRYLRIPKKDHGLTYNKAKQFASMLNKADKQPGDRNSDDSIVKQAFELCMDFNYNSKSEKVDEFFDLQGCDPATKKRLKTKLTKKIKESNQNQNWMMYDTEEGKLELQNTVNKLQKKYPGARIFSGSSAGQLVPKNIRNMTAEMANGQIHDMLIHVVYHPNENAMQKWFSDYLPKNKHLINLCVKYWPKEYTKIKKMQEMMIYMATNKIDLTNTIQGNRA